MHLLILLLGCLQQAEIFEATGIYSPHKHIPAAAAPDVPARRYLAMFTATWCAPCQSWKRTTMPQLESAGYVVKQIEMSDAANITRYGRKITRFPAFVVIDWNTGAWLSEPAIGGIDLATAKRMLDGPPYTDAQMRDGYLGWPPQETPVQRVVVPAEERALSPRVTAPTRFIQWPGWGQIDLATYNRNCNCGMCQSIRAQQQEYRRQLESFQQPTSQVTPDQEGTPHALVETILDQMQLRDSDVLGELGCGDGRILIAAARRGIKGIGVELDPARARTARLNVKSAGLDHLVTIETGDALDFDLSRVTAVTAYLYPPLLAKLSPKLKSVRVVASPYHEVPGLSMTRIGDVWISKR
jgi:hypothetical protein